MQLVGFSFPLDPNFFTTRLPCSPSSKTGFRLQTWGCNFSIFDTQSWLLSCLFLIDFRCSRRVRSTPAPSCRTNPNTNPSIVTPGSVASPARSSTLSVTSSATFEGSESRSCCRRCLSTRSTSSTSWFIRRQLLPSWGQIRFEIASSVEHQAGYQPFHPVGSIGFLCRKIIKVIFSFSFAALKNFSK